MSTSMEKIKRLASGAFALPDDAQGMGYLQDENTVIVLGFKLKRDIISEIGYYCTGEDRPVLRACLNALCLAMRDKAVINAGVSPRSLLAEQLSDDGELSENDKKYALMAELALKYACADYAKKRRAAYLA